MSVESLIPPIITSGSQYKAWLKCPRLRYWEYEHLNPDGSRGLERKRLSLPLSTGGWCHRIAQGLFQLALGLPTGDSCWAWLPENHPTPTTSTEVIQGAPQAYREEVKSRGLELGLSLDGAVEEEKFVERTIAEQSALIEAFGWAFARVRLPKILAEYDLLDVEREEFTLLAGDVGMQSRCDAVLRRKSDKKAFVYNLKTSQAPDQKWQEAWLVDQQLITEVLAVERRLGERVYGVVIDGFDKGARVQCWWDNLKEVREGYSKPPYEGAPKWQRQRSRLLYGYKCEETIPGRPTMYDFEGTTRKGWGPFAVWEESFDTLRVDYTAVEHWLNWLPIEQVEAAFVTLPPIMRLDEAVERKVRQMVGQEQWIRRARESMERNPTFNEEQLDHYFPQHDGYNCGSGSHKCSFYKVCHEGVVPSESPDLFQPRQANHPTPEGE